MLIRELENELSYNELSYIDVLWISVFDEFDQELRLVPELSKLVSADNDYLVLKKDDEVLLEFKGYKQNQIIKKVKIVAKGYYEVIRKEILC